MEALLPALLACLVVEAGDRAALLSRALSERYAGSRQVALGAACAALGNASVGAAATVMLQPMMGSGARSLFLALALLFAGVGLLFPVKMPDSLAGWRIGAFATASLGLFILGFGDAAQFLIAALGLWSGDPAFSAAGGAAGIFVGCALGMAGLTSGSAPPIALFRRVAGGLFCLAGLATSLGPLGLV